MAADMCARIVDIKKVSAEECAMGAKCLGAQRLAARENQQAIETPPFASLHHSHYSFVLFINRPSEARFPPSKGLFPSSEGGNRASEDGNRASEGRFPSSEGGN